jgi:predicted nucleotidyltransferase component of viral defense system
MNPKKIPNTDERHYISGWEALNIPDENGNTADWHPTTYLYSNSVNDTIKLYNTNDILKNRGIEKRVITYPEIKEVYISTFARAIVDLLLTIEDYQVSSLYKCRDELLTENESEELYEYLKAVKGNQRIEEFIKYEFTDKYFKENNKNGQLESSRNENINGVNVYSLEEILKMKIIAFNDRDKIRDFYDLSFYLHESPEEFSVDMLYSFKEKMDYKNFDSLALLLEDEFKFNELKEIDGDKIVLETYGKIEKLLMKKIQKHER